MQAQMSMSWHMSLVVPQYCCPSVGSVASISALTQAMAEDAEFEMAAALLGGPGPELPPPDEWAEVGDDFEAAAALLQVAPAAAQEPTPGFAARSPALLKFARTVKANRSLEKQQADLKNELSSLRERSWDATWGRGRQCA